MSCDIDSSYEFSYHKANLPIVKKQIANNFKQIRIWHDVHVCVGHNVVNLDWNGILRVGILLFNSKKM